ncbi:MAG: hypothetical protein ACXWL2_01380 [Candidatus Chromulinivorax sp.]
MKNRILFLLCLITQSINLHGSVFFVPVGMVVFAMMRNKKVFTQEELQKILSTDIDDQLNDDQLKSDKQMYDKKEEMPRLEFITSMHGYAKMQESMYKPMKEGRIRDQFDCEFTQEALNFQWEEIKHMRAEDLKKALPTVRYQN